MLAIYAVDASSFARLLRHHRVRRGLTQEELAEGARLSTRAISDLERGLKRARASTVRLLAEALGLSADEAATLRLAGQRETWQVEQGAGQSTVRHNLPRQLSSFVGRTPEVATLHAQLERTPLLTLVGPGGVGKTRLALEVAARFAASVRDGVHLVELASLTEAGLVPERVAATLGIIERTQGSLLTNPGQLLGHRHMLLVIDNCEHLVEACARLAETVLQSCPQVRVLATSREPLGVRGEQIWQVAPLSLADNASEAVQLFVERASAVAPSFSLTASNRQAVIEICRRLDGIPLAIELAAARVTTLTPAQIGARLDDRFQLLVGGSRTAHPRQQTLHATLCWSYDLLRVDDRKLFDQLAVFSGGWDLDAAELVCTSGGISADEVLIGLQRLVDRSLVLAEQGRYRMLETVRQFARERMRQSDALDALSERHARYYIQLAEAAEPELKRANQAAWFERLALEHDNLRVALRWSLDADEPAIGLRLAVALARFWEVRGHYNEARRWLAEILGAADSARQPLSFRAAGVAHAGFFAYIQGDLAAAFDMLEEGLCLARIADAPAIAAFALHGLAALASSKGEGAAQRSLLQESLAIARQLEDGWATARVLSNLGSLSCEEGDVEMGRSLLEEGLAAARRAGERRIESTLQVNLAAIALQATDLAAATTYLGAALATKAALGDRYGQAKAFRNLGWAEFESENYVAACRHFQEVLSISRDLGVVEDIPGALAGLACVAIQLKHPERAMRLSGAADRVAESVGSLRSEDANADVQYGSSARRTAMLQITRQRLSGTAETLWSEGWLLERDEVEAEAAAVARAAGDAYAPNAGVGTPLAV